MAKKGTDTRRPSSRGSGPSPFEREFPGSSESAHDTTVALVQTCVAVMSLLETSSRDLGVSVAGRQLLATLEGAGTPLSPTVISERLLVTTASITSLLDTLQKRKLIKRAPDPDDRRRILVSITAAGRKIVDTFLPQIIALQTELMSTVSEADRIKLIKLLDAIKVRVSEIDDKAVRQAAAPRGIPRHG